MAELSVVAPASVRDATANNYISLVPPNRHGGSLTLDRIRAETADFSRPALFKSLLEIDGMFTTRAYYDAIDPSQPLQWRVKTSDDAVSMRSAEGRSDYNYVTGRTGSAEEFLDDIFVHKRDVYSHLGTISSGYNDPYEWGKLAFNRIKDDIFEGGWLSIPSWSVTGHMFLGNSTQDFGEPSRGAVGSDWHMFPTLNIFVMIAGTKQWSTRPPRPGDQYRDYDKMFETSSGREAPAATFDCDVVYVEPGDVLINPPFEWHKVLNARGFTLGAAFRVVDAGYFESLRSRPNLDLGKVQSPDNEELAHFLTSISYASRSAPRAQMLLNDLEYAYLRRKGGIDTVQIGHL